jgi:hypothetical protein
MIAQATGDSEQPATRIRRVLPGQADPRRGGSQREQRSHLGA